MLFNTLTDVRLCRGQDGKLKHREESQKCDVRRSILDKFRSVVTRYSNYELFACVSVCLLECEYAHL